MKNKLKVTFYKPPTKAERLAGKLLTMQIDTLKASLILRRALGISLKELQDVDRIRKNLEHLK